MVQVEAKMEELKLSYEEKLSQKEDLKRKAEHMELMMDRARRLVDGLAGERIRWMQTVEVCPCLDSSQEKSMRSTGS